MRYLLALLILLLASCSYECRNDMEFGVKYKTVDGSWEGPLYWDLPHDSRIGIEARSGTYGMYCYSKCKGTNSVGIRLKNAVIDFRVVSKTMLYDTTKTRVELIEPNALQ